MRIYWLNCEILSEDDQNRYKTALGVHSNPRLMFKQNIVNLLQRRGVIEASLDGAKRSLPPMLLLQLWVQRHQIDVITVQVRRLFQSCGQNGLAGQMKLVLQILNGCFLLLIECTGVSGLGGGIKRWG